MIYDVFGFFPQTLQGADILATNDKQWQLRVYMPDFFEGGVADISWYPADTQEKGELLDNFFQTKEDLPEPISKVSKVMKELKSLNPQITNWAVVGYCWGGKVGAIAPRKDSRIYQVHRLSISYRNLNRNSRPPLPAIRPWSTPTTRRMSRSQSASFLPRTRTRQKSASMRPNLPF